MNLIKLDELETNVIDLKPYIGGCVFLSGIYEGDRLIIKNPVNVKVHPMGYVFIMSRHGEDAIILENPHNFTITNSEDHFGELFLNQGLTVWGRCVGLTLRDLIIRNAHTGIRINQPGNEYSRIVIEDCDISECSHEGIYIGTSKESDPKTNNVEVINCNVRDCGWDGIQIGNTHNFLISGCTVSSCGSEGTYGQDFGLTINPGSLGFIWRTHVDNSAQVLDSRVFFDKKAKI